MSEERLRIRLQLYPHDQAAHKDLIELLEKKYAFRSLVTEEAAWLKDNPGDYWALTELVSYAKNALHDPEYAIAQQRSFLARTSRTDDDQQYDLTSSMLAADLDSRGRSNEALGISNTLVKLNPDDAGLWADRSRPLIKLGRLGEAIECLRHSLALDPSLESVHEDLADALAKAGDLPGAESEYRASLSVYQAKYKKGETTNSADSLVKGLVAIEAKNHSEHSLAQTHLKLARLFMTSKKWDAAVSETAAALEADNNGLGALYLRAEIYDTSGRHKQADECRTEAQKAITKLAKDSKSTGLDKTFDMRLLFLTETPEDSKFASESFPAEVLSILEPRMMSLSPEERIALAYAYLELGREGDATEQWAQGVAAGPFLDNAVAHAGFGQRLLRLGFPMDALPHLKRAYELDPQNTTYRIDYETTKQAVAVKSHNQ